MNALELLEICECSGVKVELIDSEHIAIEPIENLSNELFNQLKQLKPDIISYLLSQQRNTAPLVVNDAQHENLTPPQQRALNGFIVMMQRQVDNLANNGYPTHSAMVNVIEWRHKVQRKLSIDGQQMQEIEAALIQQGYIAYASMLKTWLIHGDGQPLPTRSDRINNDCMHDGTAKGFYHWFNTGETLN